MQREFIVYVKMARPNKLSTGVLPVMMAKAEQANGQSSMVLSGRDHSNIVFYETRKSKRQAIAREIELKNLNRKKLTDLVKSVNPEMLDVSGIWNEDEIHFDRNSIFLE
jgi:predicted GIY-YIG superfamily endonuclease